MTDDRRGFHRLIEAGKGVKKLFDFLSEADVIAEREEEAQRAEAAAARDAPTPREGRAPYHPVEEHPSEPRPRPRACALEQHPGWRCVVEGPHAKCLLERIP